MTQTYTPRGQIAGIALDGGTVASYEYNPVGATTAKNLGLCPKGKKAQDELKKQIEKLEKDIKGHQKEINQKWPDATSQ